MQTLTRFHREVEPAERQGRHRWEWRGREDARVLRGGFRNNNERGSAPTNAERKLHGGRSRNLLSSNRNRNAKNDWHCLNASLRRYRLTARPLGFWVVMESVECGS